jgi:hypothetical protein
MVTEGLVERIVWIGAMGVYGYTHPNGWMRMNYERAAICIGGETAKT